VEADPDIIDKMADRGDIRRSTAETLFGAYTTRINMLLTPKARHNVKFVDNGLGLMKAIADYGSEHDWSRERGELMECCASICWRAYEQAAEHYANYGARTNFMITLSSARQSSRVLAIFAPW
jgi:hypothetical protein